MTRMISTVDPQARHVHKTHTHQQDGYKAHLAVDPRPGYTPPSPSPPVPGVRTTKQPSA